MKLNLRLNYWRNFKLIKDYSHNKRYKDCIITAELFRTPIRCLEFAIYTPSYDKNSFYGSTTEFVDVQPEEFDEFLKCNHDHINIIELKNFIDSYLYLGLRENEWLLPEILNKYRELITLFSEKLNDYIQSLPDEERLKIELERKY